MEGFLVVGPLVEDFFSGANPPAVFRQMCCTLLAVGPVAQVGRWEIGTGCPRGPARARKGQPGPRGETSGAKARALAAPPAPVCCPFTPYSPGTWPTYPKNVFLLQLPIFPNLGQYLPYQSVDYLTNF